MSRRAPRAYGPPDGGPHNCRELLGYDVDIPPPALQLAQEVFANPVGEGDSAIGGPMTYGEPVGSPPIGGSTLYGAPVGSAPIGGPMLYGEPVGSAPVGGEMIYGAPVETGADDAPIGGEPLY